MCLGCKSADATDQWLLHDWLCFLHQLCQVVGNTPFGAHRPLDAQQVQCSMRRTCCDCCHVVGVMTVRIQYIACFDGHTATILHLVLLHCLAQWQSFILMACMVETPYASHAGKGAASCLCNMATSVSRDKPQQPDQATRRMPLVINAFALMQDHEDSQEVPTEGRMCRQHTQQWKAVWWLEHRHLLYTTPCSASNAPNLASLYVQQACVSP